MRYDKRKACKKFTSVINRYNLILEGIKMAKKKYEATKINCCLSSNENSRATRSSVAQAS